MRRLTSIALVLLTACKGDDGTASGSDDATETGEDESSTDSESAEESGTSDSSSDDDTTTDDDADTSSSSDTDDASDTGTDDTSSTDGTSTDDTSTDDTGTDDTGTDDTGTDDTDTGDTSDTDDTDTDGNPLWNEPSLWYSVEDRLMYIEIDENDGSVVQLVTSTITTPMIDGQNGITMLEDGSLLLSRESPGQTDIYWVPEPPIVASVIDVQLLGTVPDQLRIEALYTDCQGLVYLMDTGTHNSNADGNRLIRFTGDYLLGDLDYEVITDLQMASVADIDDMGPGIDAMGEITDGQGLAIDSGTVYDFNYNTGTGVQLGSGGTWGIHALGGPLFTDATARLYLMNSDAELFEADPVDLSLSGVLVTGPEPDGDAQPGWSGLAGPLTECESTLPDPQ